MKKYYFAYGSNLDINRLQSRVGNVVSMGRHVLYGWKLVFNAGFDNQCFANIIFTGKNMDIVEGIVYQMTTRQIKKLDSFEGAPHLYTRIVHNFKNKDLQVYVSINPSYTQQEVKKIPPGKEYLQFMLNGAHTNGLITTHKIVSDLLPTASKARPFS